MWRVLWIDRFLWEGCVRVKRFCIRNFRAIQYAEAEDLQDFVVVAGTNGCGKSTILDALRLLKANYGEYNPHELQGLLQEKKINAKQGAQRFTPLFRDPSKEVRIEGTFSVSASEREYIQNNIEALLEQVAWQQIKKPVDGPQDYYLPASVRERREVSKQLREFVQKHKEAIQPLLSLEDHTCAYAISPSSEETWSDSPLLELLFSTYRATGDLGVMDYYGAHRSFESALGDGVSLSAISDLEVMRKHALTGFASKYQNLGSQIRSSYLRQLVASAAGVPAGSTSNIGDALRALFAIFFPHKQFVGPEARSDGDIHFEVKLQNGLKHSLAELSAGEKEVLFGYVRLWSGVTQRSVILLDEPELHLNPKLVSGLPRFYRDSLGRARDNQLWLVTHSDALLRSAMAMGEASVLHVQEATHVKPDDNQVRPITINSDLDRAIIDIAGDLASYRPGEVIVLLEGQGSEFDKWVIEQLFPDFASKVNLISVGDKKVSKRLHELLEAVEAQSGDRRKVYSIRDRDFDGPEVPKHTRQWQWQAYHIENALLNAPAIWAVIDERSRNHPSLKSAGDVEAALLGCARKVMHGMIRKQLETFAYNKMKSVLRTNVDRANNECAESIHGACQKSLSRLKDEIEGSLSLSALVKELGQREAGFLGALESDSWKQLFAGRDVLKNFVHEHLPQDDYELFRDQVVLKMRDQGISPNELTVVIQAIEGDMQASSPGSL